MTNNLPRYTKMHPLFYIAAGIIVGSIILNLMTVEGGVAFSSIAVGFLFSTFVGVVSGFYPAYKAAKMNPIDSLRYE